MKTRILICLALGTVIVTACSTKKNFFRNEDGEFRQ